MKASIKHTLKSNLAKGVMKRNKQKGTFKLVKQIPKTHMKRQRISELLDRGFKERRIADMLDCGRGTVRTVRTQETRGDDLEPRRAAA